MRNTGEYTSKPCPFTDGLLTMSFWYPVLYIQHLPAGANAVLVKRFSLWSKMLHAQYSRSWWKFVPEHSTLFQMGCTSFMVRNSTKKKQHRLLFEPLKMSSPNLLAFPVETSVQILYSFCVLLMFCGSMVEAGATRLLEGTGKRVYKGTQILPLQHTV